MRHPEKEQNKQLTYCKILKTNINVTDMEHTISYITQNLEALKGDYICVSNVHTTVMAFRDKKYRLVQNSAAMALPDGQPLSIVSRKRGFTQARRVPGPDLMPANSCAVPGKGIPALLLWQYGEYTGRTSEGADQTLSEVTDRRHVFSAFPHTHERRGRGDYPQDQRQRS